jgi:hypothetical protein
VRSARRPQNLGMHAQLGMLGRCSAARMQKSPTRTSGIAVDIALGLTYVLSRGIHFGLRNTKYLPLRATPNRAPNNGTAESHTTTMILITRLLSVLRNDFHPKAPARAQRARIFLSLPDSRMVAFTMWNANSYGSAYFWNSKCDAARLLGHCSLPLHFVNNED